MFRNALFLSLFLLMLTGRNACAQQEVDHYFTFGAGYTMPTFLDKSFSSLIYKGHAFAVEGAYDRRTEKLLSELSVRFDYGEMTNATSFSNVTSYRFEGNYSYERLLKPLLNNRLQWYVGGSFNSLWTLWQHQDFSNNAFNNSVYLSLSPHSSLVYNFQLWNRDFRLQGSAYLPVLTLAMRPAYGSSNFAGFLDNDRDDVVNQVLESVAFASLHNYFRYSNSISLEYLFKKNPNRIRLSYEWDYLRYSEPRLVKSAAQHVMFSTMFNF